MEILFFFKGYENTWQSYLAIFVGCIEGNNTDVQHKSG